MHETSVPIPMGCPTAGRAAQTLENRGADQRPIRVLHVNSGNQYGGVETLLVTLARLRHLCPAMEPRFALCHEGRLSRELADTGATVTVLGDVRISRPWTVWRARRRLRDLLNETPCDAVICHMPWSLVVFGKTARAAGKRLIFWAHGLHTGKTWLERMARLTVPDLAIVNSRFTAGGLSNLFRKVPAQVSYLPVALIEAPESGEWRTAVRSELQADERTAVIIQVGRMEEGKGHLLHLQALSLLRTAEPWICWIAGGGQNPAEERYVQRLRDTARQLGIIDRVRFLGERSDVPRLLAAADIFCQPNQHPEGFGITFIEALWAGRPVVTTAMGGAMEIVDSSCGVLVEPGNPAELASSLQRLIEFRELRGRLGSAGRTRALELCSPAKQINGLNELVRSAAAGRGRSEAQRHPG